MPTQETERQERETKERERELLELRRLLYKHGVPKYVEELLPMEEES